MQAVKRSTLTSLIDALALLLLIFVLLPHLPKPENKDTDVYLIRVEARWPDGWRTDVDLWVRAPDGKAVGFRNKRDGVWSLERDDLGDGAHKDVGGLNLEQARARDLPEGEYVVNVHLYRDSEGSLPVPVDLVIAIRWAPDASVRQSRVFKVHLTREREEITVARFTLRPETKDVVWHDPPIPICLFCGGRLAP